MVRYLTMRIDQVPRPCHGAKSTLVFRLRGDGASGRRVLLAPVKMRIALGAGDKGLEALG